jgi:glycosyltransferase involved in cell wall biosynthesis
LRVLLISGEYPPMEGGVGDYTRILGEAMAAQGAEVEVLTSTAAGPATGQSRICHHSIVHSWGWRTYRHVRRLVRQFAPDIINIQYQAAAYGMHPAISLLPRFMRRVPFVTTFHDLRVPYLFPKAGPLRWRAVLALARASQAAIVTNRQDEQKLEPYAGIERLERIPIGSNIPHELPPDYDRVAWRHHLGVPQNAFLLCYFGFLNASKGGEELIAAFDSFSQSDYNPHLLMIGGAVGASDATNRAYYEKVLGMIAERGLSSRVTWTGFVSPPEVSASFCAADLCVLPYRDGASFRRGSFMAALVHGMAIVTTEPKVELPELIHGENVFLVPDEDVQALQRAMEHMAADDDLRARLSRGARELARQFDWQRIAARTLALFDTIVTSR